MGEDTFYETLEIAPDLEPSEIRSHARDRIDAFRDRIENAADPEAEQRRIVLAFEVLTDPEERYLYELFGHDEYVDRRLESDELETLETGSLTAAFSASDVDDGTDTQIFDPSADAADAEIFDGDGTVEADVAGVRSESGFSEEFDTHGPTGPDLETETTRVLEEDVEANAGSDAESDAGSDAESDAGSDAESDAGSDVTGETTRLRDEAATEESTDSPASKLDDEGDSDPEADATRVREDVPGESVETDETRVRDDEAEIGSETEIPSVDDDVDDDDGTDVDETTVEDPDSGAEDDADSLAVISTEETLIERLSEFPITSSPLADLPGIRSEERREIAMAGYALGAVGLLVIIGALLPHGSFAFGLLAGFGAVLGATVTYVVGSLRYHRKLGHRLAIGVGACLPLLAVTWLGVAAGTPGSVLTVGTFAAGLFGVAAGNTYIESTRQAVREGRKEDDGRGGRNYVETDPTVGEPDDGIDVDDVFDRFTDDHSGRTAAVADDLVEESTVHATRHLVPERHIFRRLLVSDEVEGCEVPATNFAAVESRLRHDVHQRDDNHPDEFTAETYEYLVPESVEECLCPKCAGETRVVCPTCSGGGQVTCNRCHGRTHNTCRRCSGSGQVETNNGYRACSNCGGQGHVLCGRCGATGTEVCGTCSGAGDVVCDRCDGDGRVVQYAELTREYTPETEITYVDRSVPVSHLEPADGTQTFRERERNTAPDADSGDVFMREHEVREIPTDVLTYEYAGDLWEVYDVEENVTSPAYPHELSTRVRVLAVANVAALGLYVYAGALGPAALP